MPPQPTRTAVEEDDLVDAAILGLLLHDETQRLWSEDELAREVGSAMKTADCLTRLYSYGLIHRLQGFAWATRAALMATAIES